MCGYCPWPAKIVGSTQNHRRVKCYFYGSHNNGTVDVNRVIPFEKGLEVIRLINLRHTKNFAKEIREIEIENGVPEELSALREMQSIE